MMKIAKPMRKLILLLITLVACVSMASAQEENEDSGIALTIDDLRTFTDVFNQLRSNFVDEVDDHTLLVAAIEGMVSKLDPYSAFLDPDQSQVFDDSSRGRYGGIGIRIDLRDNRIVIDEVTPDGPAEREGVIPGDVITAVQGRSVRERNLFDSVDALKGEPGSKIKIRVRTGQDRSRELELVREFIPVTSVESRLLEDDFGYFEISHFHLNSHFELEREIQKIQADRNKPLLGIILDLRGNPGGAVRPAVEMADGFLDEGLIVYTRGRYEATRLEFRAHPGQWASGVPLALLVNGRSASASEVLTGALKDHGRAIVIGEKTFGKGSIQSIFKLRNGSTLKLTTAHYFTPSGATIHENGIQPDISMNSQHQGLAFLPEPEIDTLVLEAIQQFKKGNSSRHVKK